jgi:hypothetical protein
VRCRDLGDERILEEMRSLHRMLEIYLHIASRAEDAVCGDGDTFFVDKVDQMLLHEIRVMFNLESCGTNAGISKEI